MKKEMEIEFWNKGKKLFTHNTVINMNVFYPFSLPPDCDRIYICIKRKIGSS